MVAVANNNTFSEDQIGKKIDRCITDTLVKAGMVKNKCVTSKMKMNIHFVDYIR